MDPNTKNTALGAAGAAGAAGPLGVEDVFSTTLYEGTGSTQTITNGIDLSGEGGLVWIKRRTGTAESHALFDTERGVQKYIKSDTTDLEYTRTDTLSAFNSDGFSFSGGFGAVNFSSQNYASWTFRKAPGFFDVVTYTGNSASSRTVSHNLGSVPGAILIKQTSSTGNNWCVYHRILGTAQKLSLNTTDVVESRTDRVIGVSSSTFTLGNSSEVNYSGSTYVAYLFAHDEAIFGENQDQSIIKCGSYTGNGSSSGPVVNLGWEPQWIMVKRATDVDGGVGPWYIQDAMRNGDVTSNVTNAIQVNDSAAETVTAPNLGVTATGFQPRSNSSYINSATSTYIYIAIRRGPMKTPTDATTVFDTTTSSDDGGGGTISSSTVTADATWTSVRTAGWDRYAITRLSGGKALRLNTTGAEADFSAYWELDEQYGFRHTGFFASNSIVEYTFRRAHGFFDVVAYTGTGSATTVSHNLGVVPELMIVKSRSNSSAWTVYSPTIGTQPILKLQSTVKATDFGSPGPWNNTTPTSSVFSVSATGWDTNNSGVTYIAYLFASCPGVSKVGTYTGTGSNISVDCGFSAGARFVLIRRTDDTGDWYVWDTVRGIVTGNDPYLFLNSNAAEVTTNNYIGPYASGFTVLSTAPAALNASGGTYIFLAIA